MPNSCSSTLPLFNALDMLIWNTADADVTMSTNFMTVATLFWYFLVSTIAMPLTLIAAREMVSLGILTGRSMNVPSVTTLDIPEAMLRPLEQAFSHVSQSKVLECLLCFFLYLFLASTTLFTFLGSCLIGMEPKVQLDTNCNSSSFLKDVMKMADIHIDPFDDHDKMDALLDG